MSRDSVRDAAFEAVTDGIVVLTGAGTVADCNPAAATALGVDRAAAVGRPLSAVAPDLAAEVDDATSEDRDGAGSDGAPAGRVVDPVGEDDRTYEVRVSPFERDGEAGRVVELRDVTERRLHRRRLSVLNRVIRHDLRNAMNVVLGYVEVVEDRLETGDAAADDPGGDRPQPDGATPTERIREAATTMLDLSSRIREVEATLDATESTETTLDVVGLVETLAGSLTLEHPRAAVSVDAPESAWVAATDVVDSAFDNLLENAVVHNHRERPTVEVTVRREGDRVAVTVADDGPGISRQELDSLRSPGETQLTHSSGVGLWQVVWLVEESGGDVAFDVDDAGTAVTVRLPAAAPPE